MFFSYGFMTLATIVITAICLLLVLGYRFDVRDGQIEQGGLIQFRSAPEGARITVDGMKMANTTSTKYDVAAGSHDVMMSLDGYHTWQKTVKVGAGELRWLNYARLIPTTLTTTTLTTLPEGSTVLYSPNRQYMAQYEPSRPKEIRLYDLRDPKKITHVVYTLPETVITTRPDVPSVLTLDEWDRDGRYLLVTHTAGDAREIIRLDRAATGGAPHNITTQFKLPFHAVHFSGTSGAIVYALTDHDLRRVDIAAASVSQPIVSGVESYSLFKDSMVAYVAVRGDQKLAGLYMNNTDTVVRTLAVTEPVWVDVAEYYSDLYFAVGSRTHADIIKDPVEFVAAKTKLPFVTISLPYEMTWLEFARSGRMLAMGAGRAHANYDLETRETAFVHPTEVGSDSVPRWLDDYYHVDNPAGMVRLYEFDGLNSHELVAAERTMPVVLSPDEKSILTISRDKGVLSLQSTRLVK